MQELPAAAGRLDSKPSLGSSGSAKGKGLGFTKLFKRGSLKGRSSAEAKARATVEARPAVAEAAPEQVAVAPAAAAAQPAPTEGTSISEGEHSTTWGCLWHLVQLSAACHRLLQSSARP